MTNPEQEVVDTIPTKEVVDQPEVREEEAVPAEEGQLAETESAEGNEEEQEEELEEIEWDDGKKYRIPKSLKGGLLRQSDYTKKTQEVASERKAILSKKEEIEKDFQSRQANFQAYAEVYSIDQKIGEYTKIDWNKLMDDDPIQAIKLDKEYRILKEEREKRLYSIANNERELTQKQQQTLARLEEDSSAELRRDIKGWSPDLQNQLTSYAKSLGAKEENIKNVIKYSPLEVKVLHKAYLYDQLQKRASQSPAPEEAKPVPKVSSGKSSPMEYRVGMSPEQYDRWRERQKKKR